MKQESPPNTTDADTLASQAAIDLFGQALAGLESKLKQEKRTREIAELDARIQAEQKKRERTAEQVWPDPDTLAMLAGQARFAELPDADAARAALKLQNECLTALEQAKENVGQRLERAIALPNPKQWPATLTDFYKLVVRCKQEKDNPLRFLRFLRFRAEGRGLEVVVSRIDGEKLVHTFKRGTGEQAPTQSAEAIEQAAERHFAEYRVAQFNQEAWFDLARDYRRWWAWDSTESKRRAGQARADKAAETKRKRRKASIERGGVKVTGEKAGAIKLTEEILAGAAAKDAKPDFQKKSSPPS